MPGFQAAAHHAKIKLFHEQEILVHVQEYITGDLLLLEDVAMLLIDADVAQVFGGLLVPPLAHLVFRRTAFLLLVRFVTVDVGEATTQGCAVFAARIVIMIIMIMMIIGGTGSVQIGGSEAMTWRAEIGDVLINDAEGFVHDGAILTVEMATQGILRGVLEIQARGIARRQGGGADTQGLFGRDRRGIGGGSYSNRRGPSARGTKMA